MDMNCQDARPLVDAYLDGELSEARAGLLRKHLLDCHPCRTGAQGGRNLKRWFEAARQEADARHGASELAVPSGFAARVARRAFAGDMGRRDAFEAPLTRRKQDPEVLRFVLTATAIAASVALALAIGLGLRERPATSAVSADDRAPAPVKEVVEELERLNAADAALAPRPASPKPTSR